MGVRERCPYAVLALVTGQILAFLALTVVAQVGVDYGLPGQVALRATLGYWGARLLSSPYRVVAATYWFAAQALGDVGADPKTAVPALSALLKEDVKELTEATGKVLQRIPLKQPAGGGVVTYQAGGAQRIGVAAGLEDTILEAKGNPIVIVFGL